MNKFILMFVAISILACTVYASEPPPTYSRIYNTNGQRIGGTKSENGVKTYFNRSGTITAREYTPYQTRYSRERAAAKANAKATKANSISKPRR